MDMIKKSYNIGTDVLIAFRVFLLMINFKLVEIKFLNRCDYLAFIANVLFASKFYKTLRFVKFRLRGLGYRIYELTKSVYAFSFNRTNYIYFYVPLGTVMRVYKKRIILISIVGCC